MGATRRRRPLRIVAALAALAVAASCTPQSPRRDVEQLAGNGTDGRDNGTAGSAMARRYLLSQLAPIARGARAASGPEAYLQHFPTGTNVVAVIPGTDLRDQYVLVGAHYDHLGHDCPTANPADTICNGATDNAAGDAAVLAVGRALAAERPRPRRSVILAFWDAEEDGMVGSQYYVRHPLVPLSRTVAELNFDIQGADLTPSLRTTTFAVGAESGGSGTVAAVRRAAAPQALRTTVLSALFGEYRSDYGSFLSAHVPTVFFTDSTGPCYHTAQDEVGVVDFRKLDLQIRTALNLTRALAGTDHPPRFDAKAPAVTYDDLVTFGAVIDRAWSDIGRDPPGDRAVATRIRDDIHRFIAAGRAAFTGAEVDRFLADADEGVTLLADGPCTGFQSP